jgi:hypothetical protein
MKSIRTLLRATNGRIRKWAIFFDTVAEMAHIAIWYPLISRGHLRLDNLYFAARTISAARGRGLVNHAAPRILAIFPPLLGGRRADLRARQSSPNFRRSMTAWTRSRRKRSALAGVSAAYSTGGARNKGRLETGGDGLW